MSKNEVSNATVLRDRRALSDADVAPVIQVLEGWAGERLTWPLLISAVAAQTGRTYPRQALLQHSRVQLAFALKRATLERDVHASRLETGALSAAMERIARQERTIARLMLENHRLTELLQTHSRANGVA